MQRAQVKQGLSPVFCLMSVNKRSAGLYEAGTPLPSRLFPCRASTGQLTLSDVWMRQLLAVARVTLPK